MHLYSAPLSLFARKVEIVLAEKALQFDRTMVPFSQTAGYKPKHDIVLASNPKGQVPVLVDDDLALYDSTVIIEYLEEAYPEPPLFPKDPRNRARCRQLELEADEVLLDPVRRLMFRSEPPVDPVLRKKQEAEAANAEARIVANHAALDRILTGEHFLCGAFSVADIATFMTVHWSQRLGAPSLESHAALAAWYRRLSDRPAIASVVTAIARADAELSHPVAPRAF